MKKHLYLFSLLLICTVSCKSYQDFLSIEDTFNPDVTDSLENGTHILSYVNGVPLKLLFDTGAARSVISDLEALGGEGILNDENYDELVKVEGADGAATQLGLLKLDSLSINSLKSLNRKVYVQDNINSFECNANQVSLSKGIYGIDALKYSDIPLVLDYEQNRIYFTEQPEYNYYQEVHCKISASRIYVYLQLNGEKYKMLFDTGNNSGLIWTEQITSEKNSFSYNVLTQLVNDKLINRTIELASLDVIKSKEIELYEVPYEISLDLKDNNMGLQFINKFNWVIDFKNEKMYAKRIEEKPFISNEKKLTALKYAVAPINKKLYIALNATGNLAFNVGDVITAVGDKTITDENLCEYFELLNSNHNWESLSLSTKTQE